MLYIARNKQRLGPYSPAQLQEFARAGRLQQEDMVLPQGQQKWIQASSIAGLFPSKALRSTLQWAFERVQKYGWDQDRVVAHLGLMGDS